VNEMLTQDEIYMTVQALRVLMEVIYTIKNALIIGLNLIQM